MYILGLLASHQFLLLPLSVYSYESHNIPCRVAEEEEGSANLLTLGLSVLAKNKTKTPSGMCEF